MTGIIDTLTDALCGLEGVICAGKSGGFSLSNGGDIDIFVICVKVPSANKRRCMLEKIQGVGGVRVSPESGRFWGFCDYMTLRDTVVCLMYFSAASIDRDIDSVLNGSRLDREGEYYYPTGRCASFLNMQALFDSRGYISAMKQKLSQYPQSLAVRLYNHHIALINDEEDFGRAVSRVDILFYHSTLELALDHFLQALFALNRSFFPSRKRSFEYIEGFKTKPSNCARRLSRVISDGARPETLASSYGAWRSLCGELTILGENLI